jgi:hypothetical protein
MTEEYLILKQVYQNHFGCSQTPTAKLPPSPANRPRNGAQKREKKMNTKVFATSIELCLSVHVFIIIPKTLCQKSTQSHHSAKKVVHNFVQVGSPNYTHTNNTNMLTPLSKRSPNSPFYTPFPSHISHQHPDKYSPNRTTVIPSSPPPNTLKTGKNKVVMSGGRGRALQKLNGTQ